MKSSKIRHRIRRRKLRDKLVYILAMTGIVIVAGLFGGYLFYVFLLFKAGYL